MKTLLAAETRPGSYLQDGRGKLEPAPFGYLADRRREHWNVEQG